MKILIAGTNFRGRNDLKTQGQFLHESLQQEGFRTGIISSFRNPLLRAVDAWLSPLLKLTAGDVLILQVYSTWSLYATFLSAWAGKRKHATLVATLHGGNIPQVYRSNRRKRKILQYLIRHCKVITAPTAYFEHVIPELKASGKFRVIKNQIELDHYKPAAHPQKPIALLWMRAYHENYDPAKALAVVAKLLEHGQEVSLHMAGKDYGLKAALQTQIQTLGLTQQITLHGVIDLEEKHKLAAASNIYLCTNQVDNAPVSFLEMMALGLPVVSTRVGGIPYFVNDEVNALLSSDNSVDNLCDLILQVHQQSELRTKLQHNGFEFIKSFSREQVVLNWKQLLSTLS